MQAFDFPETISADFFILYRNQSLSISADNASGFILSQKNAVLLGKNLYIIISIGECKLFSNGFREHNPSFIIGAVAGLDSPLRQIIFFNYDVTVPNENFYRIFFTNAKFDFKDLL